MELGSWAYLMMKLREVMELGIFDDEIAPVEGPKTRGKNNDPPIFFSADEEPNSAKFCSFLH